MRSGAREVAALARFELRQLLHAPETALGLFCLVALLALGHWSYWSGLPPRPDGDRLFGYGYIAALITSLRIGLAADGERCFDRFLTPHLVSPARYLAGKLAAVAVHLAALGISASLLALALSAGELRYALWYPVLFTLVAWLFLPALFAAELLLRIRLPGAVVFAGFVAALAASEPLFGARAVADFLGLEVERYDYASLGPLVGRCIAATALLPLLYLPWRRRLVGPRRTRSERG